MEVTVANRGRERSVSRLVAWGGLGAFIFSVSLTALGTFSGERDETQVDFYWVNVLLAALAAALVFGVTVRRTLGGGDVDAMSRRAQLLGAGSLVLLVVFWSGIPQVLAVAAAVVGAETRDRAASGAARRRATTGVTLAAVSSLLLVLLALQEVIS